jgi:hypothetical protein
MKKLFTFLLSILLLSVAYAQLPGWDYKKNVYVKNTAVTAATDFQMLVTVNTAVPIAAGKMKADGSDIRFTMNGSLTELNYWIEEGINTAATKIWVRIPSVVASGRTAITMYYGNTIAAAVSNGDNTFPFFDDFSTLDAAKWYSYVQPGVTQTVSNGKLVYSGPGYANLVSRNMGITAPFTVHTKVNGFSAYSWDLGVVGYAKEDNSFTRVNFFSGIALREGTGFSSVGSPVTISSSTTVTSTLCTQNYEFVSKVLANGQCNITTPGGPVVIPSSSSTVNNATRVSLGYFYNNLNATGVCAGGRIYDHLFVRSYAATEPTLDSTGAEQPAIVPVELELDKDSLHFSAAPGGGVFNITSNSAWTIDTPASWVTVSVHSGNNSASLGIAVEANPGAARSALITVAAGTVSKTIFVSQDATVDSLDLDRDSLGFTASGGTQDVNVTSNIAWTVDAPASWITVSANTGSNDGILGISAAANVSVTGRSAFVTVAGGTITRTILVTQSGASAVLDLDTDNFTFAASAGTKSLEVTSNIAWTVDTPAAWLSVSVFSGTNNGTINVSAEANALGMPRASVLTVRGGSIVRQVVVLQDVATGLEDLYSKHGLSVFPNPSQGAIEIGYKGTQKVKAILFDLNGKALHTFMLEPGSTVLRDLSDLSDGVYFIQLNGAHQSKPVKVVIAR